MTHLHRDYDTAFCGLDAAHIPMTHDPAEADCKPCLSAHGKYLLAEAELAEAERAEIETEAAERKAALQEVGELPDRIAAEAALNDDPVKAE